MSESIYAAEASFVAAFTQRLTAAAAREGM
jgi:hypothetical protein